MKELKSILESLNEGETKELGIVEHPESLRVKVCLYANKSGKVFKVKKSKATGEFSVIRPNTVVAA